MINIQGELVEYPDLVKDLSKGVRDLESLEVDHMPKWGGSLLFLKKYVTKAIEHLRRGPREWRDPEVEFIE